MSFMSERDAQELVRQGLARYSVEDHSVLVAITVGWEELSTYYSFSP